MQKHERWPRRPTKAAEYIPLREALRRFAGMVAAELREPSLVSRLRREGVSVKDWKSDEIATDFFWRRVDRGQIPIVAGTNDEGPPVLVPPDLLREVPLLSRSFSAVPNSRGTGSLSMLRPSHPAFGRFVALIGPKPAAAILMVRTSSIEGAISIWRAMPKSRRHALPRASVSASDDIKEIGKLIAKIIEAGEWDTSKPLKLLALLVHRRGRKKHSANVDTVARALDYLYQLTGDQRFVRRRRRATTSRVRTKRPPSATRRTGSSSTTRKTKAHAS
jgi:hypothetical protein